MNEENLIQDFFRDVRRRSPSKGAPRKGLSIESAEDDNLIHATMGFGFRCGVCGTNHSSAFTEKVQSLKACIQKLVVQYTDLGKGQMKYVKSRSRRGRAFQRRYHQPIREDRGFGQGEVGYKFGPSPEAPDTLSLIYRDKNPLKVSAPNNSLLNAICPRFVARCGEEETKFEDVFAREMKDDVSIREALGSPDTFKYVEARAASLKERAELELAQVAEAHREENKEFLETIQNWRTVKPEKWSYKPKDFLTRFKVPKFMEGLKFVEYAVVAGKNMHESEIMKSFKRVTARSPLLVRGQIKYHRYVVLDVGLVEGFPALSWATLNMSSYAERKDTGKVAHMTHFLSFWDGRTFLNRETHGRHFEVKAAWANLSQSFLEVSPVIKDSKESDEE